MKFGQLIECNMRNIFLEKSYTKYCRETISRSFSKEQKLSISLGQYSKVFIYFVFVCQFEDYQKWFKLSCRPVAFTSHKAFLKNKKRSGTSLLTSFSAWFLKKNISAVIFSYLIKFQCLVAFNQLVTSKILKSPYLAN